MDQQVEMNERFLREIQKKPTDNSGDNHAQEPIISQKTLEEIINEKFESSFMGDIQYSIQDGFEMSNKLIKGLFNSKLICI